jgi:cysteine-rich repeat protein
MRQYVWTVVCLCAASCALEVPSSERLPGYGDECEMDADCDAEALCHFGRCVASERSPAVDAGPMPGADAGPTTLDSGIPDHCGDGVTDADEGCDDGNRVATDACTDRCQPATCGDGILRTDLVAGEGGFEACDDGDADSTDFCVDGCALARCGDGHLWADVEQCDDSNAEDGDGCSALCRNEFTDGDGSTPNDAALSCATLHRADPGLPSGSYWLSFAGNPWQALCEMNVDGGGWTRMMRVNRGDLTWNAWTTHHGDGVGSAPHGFPLDALSTDDDGYDLSFMVKVDDVQRGPIYRHVHRSAWVSAGPTGVLEGDFFEYRNVDTVAFNRCEEAIQHGNNAWNWSICRTSGRGCAGYSQGGCFLLHGDIQTEIADQLWGLNSYRREQGFSAVEVWVREL